MLTFSIIGACCLRRESAVRCAALSRKNHPALRWQPIIGADSSWVEAVSGSHVVKQLQAGNEPKEGQK